MKFALVDGVRFEAAKELKGVCPICSSELIARCGRIKINHWAHKSIRNCDQWWEAETEWHRRWKENYPVEWQEITLFDELTNEKHIADIKSEFKLIIEFQHSPITPEERISREKFYKNMLWVVDGSRLKNDFTRFMNGKNSLFFKRTTHHPDLFNVEFPHQLFSLNWLQSDVPVIFDFRGLSIEETDETKNALWCLFPKHNNQTFVRKINRDDFIKITLNSPSLFTQSKPHQLKQTKNQIIRPSPTHYFDPGKDRFVRKKRF